MAVRGSNMISAEEKPLVWLGNADLHWLGTGVALRNLCLRRLTRDPDPRLLPKGCRSGGGGILPLTLTPPFPHGLGGFWCVLLLHLVPIRAGRVGLTPLPSTSRLRSSVALLTSGAKRGTVMGVTTNGRIWEATAGSQCPVP